MTSFDLIESSNKGYGFVWHSRHSLLRLALVPAVIKIVTFATIIALGLENNILRQGLVALPSYFAEGWLVAVAVRMAFFREDFLNLDPSQKQIRDTAVWGSVIVYVLTKLVLSFLTGIIGLGAAAAEPPVAPTAPTAEVFVFIMMISILSVWAFRFTWLYVPVALGYRMREFFPKIKGFSVSFQMLGLWFVCFVPAAMLLLGISKILHGIFPDGEAFPHPVTMTLMIIAQSALELCIALVSSVAMAHGFIQLMSDRPRTGTLV